MVHFEIPPSCGVPASDPQKVAKVTRSIDPLGGPMKVELSRETRSFPTTITLCARGTPGDASDFYPESILQAPSIQAALRAQPVELIVERQREPVGVSSVVEIAPVEPVIAPAPIVPTPVVVTESVAPIVEPTKKKASKPNVTVEEN